MFNVTSHSDTNTFDSVLELNVGVNEGVFVMGYSVEALNNIDGEHGFANTESEIDPRCQAFHTAVIISPSLIPLDVHI